jgi:hypothetical protein
VYYKSKEDFLVSNLHRNKTWSKQGPT